MICFVSALLIFFYSTTHAATITQSTVGDCSPTVANVTGDIVIHCEGIDAKALNRLNELLELKDRDLGEARKNLDDKIQEANEWAGKYHELERRFSSSGEISELSSQVNQALKNGDFVTVGGILDQLLIQQEGDIDKIAANHYSRGQVYDLQNKSQLAQPHYEKAYRYRPEIFEYAFEYARTLQYHYDFIKAEVIYNEQLVILRRYAAVNPSIDQPRMARVLNNLGLIYVATQRLQDAEKCYNEALRIRRELASNDPKAYSLDLVQTLGNLSTLYQMTGRSKDAIIASKEGMVITQEFLKSNPSIYPPAIGRLIDNLAVLFRRGSANYSEAEQVLKQYISLVRDLASSNPAMYRYLALALNMLASLHEAYLRWEEAVTIYEESVNIIRELTVSNQVAYRLDLANTLGHLGLVYALTWKRTESKNAYQEASNIYRDLFTVYPALHKPFLADTLHSLARAQLVTMEETVGIKNFQESIDLYRELVAADPIRYRPILANTLLDFVVLVDLTQSSPTVKEIQYIEEAVGIYRNLWLENSEWYSTELSYALTVFRLVVSRSKNATPTACRLAREIEKVPQNDRVIQDSTDKLIQTACH